jgi:hypothetical protein
MHRCGTYSCIDCFNCVDGLRVLHELYDVSGCADEHQIGRGLFRVLLRLLLRLLLRRRVRAAQSRCPFIFFGLDHVLCDGLCC